MNTEYEIVTLRPVSGNGDFGKVVTVCSRFNFLTGMMFDSLLLLFRIKVKYDLPIENSFPNIIKIRI